MYSPCGHDRRQSLPERFSDAGQEVGRRAADVGVTIRPAEERDIPAIVAVLADDPLGACRGSPSVRAYRDAFACVDADPHQLLTAVDSDGRAVVGTMQLMFLPGLVRRSAARC